MRNLPFILGLLVISTCAQAQWSTTSIAGTAYGEAGNGARADNDEGASVHIFLTAQSQLVGEFTLGNGLLSLDPVTCPTLQIDENLPEDFNLSEHQCDISGARARFILTYARDGQVDSKTFRELMNGSRLVVRYRLQGAGYGQQVFSLKGSKQVLKTTLSQDMVVIED